MPVSPEESRKLLDPACYMREGYPYEIWKKLRQEEPIHRSLTPEGDPFWAVTRYQDIRKIETNAAVFRNSPRLVMGAASTGDQTNTIVSMDPPEHTIHRALAQPRVLPKNIVWLRELVQGIVTETLDNAMARNGEVINLQAVLSNPVPTAVVAAFLGVPRSFWPQIHQWTDTIINASDPHINKGENPRVVMGRAVAEMSRAYGEVFAERRRNPRDDLMTDLVNARIDGEPLSEKDLVSWCFILTTAGHETTQSTHGAGIKALIEQPEQLAKLRENPELIPRAVEEMIRFVSPAVHFCRTPNVDIEVGDKLIRAGEHMVMFYPSANRDEEVFEQPNRLNIERFPNPHLAFGVGPHQCLGMHLARMELNVMLEQFLKRVELIEIAGEPERVHSCITSGFKSVPVRMEVKPA